MLSLLSGLLRWTAPTLSTLTHSGITEKPRSPPLSTTGGGRCVCVCACVRVGVCDWFTFISYCKSHWPVYIVGLFTLLNTIFIQVNTVFDHLRVTTDFNGYVFFLEEDHYLSPDFVHVAKRLVALKREQCQDCDLVNMGTYQKSSFAAMSSQVSSHGFWDSRH